MADITVGASLPKTGRYADSAFLQYSRAYELWVNDLNAAGGLLGRQVKLVWHDDEGDGDKCAANYDRLINEDKVDLLLGPCHSVLIEPAAPVIEKNHMVMLEGSGSVSDMFRKGREWLFLCWGVDRDYMQSFLEFMKSSANPKPISKIAVIGAARARGGGHIFGVEYHAEKMGLDIVFNERLGQPPVDYDDLLARAYAANPDVLLWDVEAREPDAEGAIDKAIAAGFAPSQIWLSDNPSQRGNQPTGLFMRCTWMETIPRPGSLKFVEDFTKAYGIKPEYHSAGGYACGQVLAQAVEQTGSLDNEAIRKTMLSGSFRTVMGTLGFDPDGLPTGTFPVVQWQDNVPEIVYPEGIQSKPAIFS
jgi:branched-chain amino acid transport system substrate-binding protein